MAVSNQSATLEANREIATACRDTAAAADEALSWMRDNPEKVRQDALGLARELRKCAKQARRLELASSRPMCVSVFGPSQSGKSYLVSALARSEASPLMALFEGEPINFVQRINPEGGGESTGLVTRFTVKRVPTPSGMPVILRLLTEADLIKILGNTYYSDFDLSNEEYPGQEEIAQQIQDLRGRAEASPVDRGLSEDDVYDVQEYFEQNFRDRAGIAILRANFWREAAQLAPRLQGTDRARLFGLIWNGIDRLTEIYQNLRAALAKLNFAEMAFCPLEALVPQPRKGDTDEDQRARSIINVRTLDELGRKDVDVLTASGSDGARTALDRAVISALTAELTVVMADQPWPFLEHTDLLDFPGARSRKEIPDPRRSLAEDGKFQEPFLRGKVAYLFQRYVADQEINAMILCLAPGNQEVTSLPRIINDWVAAANGAVADLRDHLPTALFLVLTKFDFEFEEKEGQSEKSESRWKTRFRNSFEFLAERGVYDWTERWTAQGAFTNTFWLRNPNVKQRQFLEYDSAGREIGLLPAQQTRIARMRDEFLASPVLSGHFVDPTRAWDEAWKPNDGGVSYLAEQLTPVCEPALKRGQIAARLAGLRRHMAGRLQPFHVSGDLAQELARRRTAAEAVADNLVEVASNQKFGMLLARFQVGYDELADAYYRIRMQGSQDGARAAGQTAAAAIVGRGPDAGKMRQRLGFARPGEHSSGKESSDTSIGEPALDQVDRFADAALAEWMQALRTASEDDEVARYFGGPSAMVGVLCDELIAGAKRLGLREQIAQRIRPFDAFRQTAQQAVAKPVLVAQNALNSYVDWLGFDRMPLADRPQPGEDGHPIFAPREPAGEIPDLSEEPAPYDEAIYVDWITGFLALVDDNVRKHSGQSVDIASNAKLGALLERLAALPPG